MKNKTFLILMGIILVGFLVYYFISNYNHDQKVEGYWCHYNATGSLVVLIKDNYSKSEKTTIEKYLKTITGLKNYDFITKDKLSNQGIAYDSYFIYYDNNGNIKTVINDLKKLDGVQEVIANTIKSDLEMYYLMDNSYAYYQIIVNNPVYKGGYEVNQTKIILDNKKELYLNKDNLCADKECHQVFTKTNKLCE